MKKTIITVVSLLIVLLVLIYGYEFTFNKPLLESPIISEEVESYVPTIEVKEQYKDSVYTFVGDIQVPTPCHSLKSKVTMISETLYQIEVTTISPSSDTICAQVLTDKSYKVSFEAEQDIVVTVLIDGVEYRTNRFLIPLDQNIETFNLEIKG